MRSLAPVAAIQFVGNTLLLWLGYYWLGIGESRASTLAWSLIVALLLIAAACCLHGATLAWFSVAKRRLAVAFQLTLTRLGLLIAAAIVVLAVYLLLARWEGYSSLPAFRIASFLTKTFRKPVKPTSVLSVFNAALWLVRWMIVPMLILPRFAAVLTRHRRRRSWFYWIATPFLLLCALWLPLVLLGWKPHMPNFAMEMFSFLARLLVAYSLFVTAWMALEFLTSGGSPRETQPSTVASP